MAEPTPNPYLGAANPYLQQVIDSTTGDMVRSYNTTAQPAFNAAMVRSGSFGNSGVDEMNRDAQDRLQKGIGDASSKLRFGDYTQQQDMYRWQQGFDTSNKQWDLGFDRQVYNDAYGQNINNLQVGMGLLGTMNGYTNQDINNSTTQQNAPLNYWQQFSQGANSMGQGYGTTTGTQQPQTNPWASALGGAQLGTSAYRWWNQNSNTSKPIGSDNGYGNTFQQNGFSADQAYG